MFQNVFLKTLHDQRRGLVGWSAGVVLLVFVEAAIWPSIRDMSGLEDFFAEYPEGLGKLFNIEAMTTGIGFMNAELFSLLLPTLFIIYGVGRGARLVAGEEEAGTLDLLLVTPVSGAKLLIQKALALFLCLATLGGVLFGVTVVSSMTFDLGIGAGAAVTGALAMVLLGVEYGALALALGAISGRRTVAITLATVGAVAAYVLYAAGMLVPSVGPWQQLSPFHQALTGGPLGADLSPAYLWMVAATLVMVLGAAPVLDRRDIAAHG